MKKITNVLLIILALVIVSGCNNKTVKLDKNGTTKKNVVTEKMTFKNINLVYEDGITTLTADIIKNNNKEAKLVTINLNNEDGKPIKKISQIIDPSDDINILTVGIIGDYSYIKNVTFDVEDVKEK